jgi:endonuclease/exonuclease/phosphatase family metal-dependent hydrolase
LLGFSTVKTLTCAAALVSILLTSACGGNSPANPSSAGTPTSSGRVPVQLKVMTFNIQHGITGADEYDLKRAIDTIAKIQPDLVALQEVTRNHPYYNCEDQPVKIADGLKAATGRPWSVVYEQEWFTPNVECRDGGRGDGKETEGLAFLAPGPLGAKSMTPLPVSRIALTVIWPAAGGIPVTVTHLANGRQNNDARAREVEALLKWTAKLGDSQIVLGDFNLKPEEPALQPMLTMFRDAWAVGRKAGTTAGPEATRGNSRVDYLFYKGPALTLTGIESVETATWFVKPASDHRPVVATFRVDDRGKVASEVVFR